MEWVYLPKGFYSLSSGTIVEHLVNEVVHGFLSLREALNFTPNDGTDATYCF
jgi:hypothetical protein